MQGRLSFLKRHKYMKEIPFFSDDLKEALEEIYHLQNIVDISNMDNDLSYEYLVALDNKGFLAQSVDLGNGIYMETMDIAIEERDLHYLYVQVSTVKPFIVRSIWRYLKGNNGLEVFEDALTDEHKKAFEGLSLLAEKYRLIYVSEDDLKMEFLEDGEKTSFYKKYFDKYSD